MTLVFHDLCCPPPELPEEEEELTLPLSSIGNFFGLADFENDPPHKGGTSFCCCCSVGEGVLLVGVDESCGRLSELRLSFGKIIASVKREERRASALSASPPVIEKRGEGC